MTTNSKENDDIDSSVGNVVKNIREENELTARQLAQNSGVSAAMISRIESGQVSPSIATMAAISQALDIPVASLFRDASSEHVDFTLVNKGEGLKSTRMVGEHIHHYSKLAHHRRKDLQLEAQLITIKKQDAEPPSYIGQGISFMYILSGEALFRYAKQTSRLAAGDSLCLDAEMSYGFVEIISDEFKFLSVQCESRK